MARKHGSIASLHAVKKEYKDGTFTKDGKSSSSLAYYHDCPLSICSDSKAISILPGG